MQFSWNEKKRRSNFKVHGLDFVDCAQVFAGWIFTYEDARFDYHERRFVTLGMLANTCVSIVHTETVDEIHLISFRRASRNEEKIFFESINNQG